MIGKLYKNPDKLVAAMGVRVSTISKRIAESTAAYLKYVTIKNLYKGMSDSKFYKRTGGLKESIVCNANINGNYRIGFDGRKIKDEVTNDGSFNAHADFEGNKVQHDDYIRWIEEGHMVPKGRNDHYFRDGAWMIEETKIWLSYVFAKISHDRSRTLSKAVEKAIGIYGIKKYDEEGGDG